jgi:hypothetical protein
MHAIINRIHFGNFRFLVELEARDETEPGQITLWVEEKIDVSTLPLSEFTLEQLLYAVREPSRGRLHTQLEAQREKLRQGRSEKSEIPPEKKRSKGRVKNTVSDLRRQQGKTLLQFEHDFRQNQLLALDRTAYNLEILQAESHIFGETRFLHHFKDGEIDDSTLRQRCFQFAFDSERRAQMLEEAGKQPQPARQIFG